MDGYFDEMLRRLGLTKLQRNDAQTKYTGVAKVLHAEFYDSEYDGSTKLLIGSYGKKTNIRPPKDVDMVFKLPLESFEQYQNHAGNGPSALLQKIREVLGEKYTATDKIAAWGKVVLVEFADGSHNVELLPGYEVDGVFMIPNTEDGGSWESFDARADIKLIANSHAATGGKTRKLIKIIKRWRQQNHTISLKTYELEQYCVQFFEQHDHEGLSSAKLVKNFFDWLVSVTDKDTSFIETARARATKALNYEAEDDIKNACAEWRKIFGTSFPAYSQNLSKIHALAQQYPSDKEEFIEDIFRVNLNPEYSLGITSTVSGKGWLTRSLESFLSKYSGIPKNLSVDFQAVTNVPGTKEFWWKVRNFGDEAKTAMSGAGLRGEIVNGGPDGKKRESTLYNGTHYVECYVIQDDVCVAKMTRLVPINQRT